MEQPICMEFPFKLPVGLLLEEGVLLREGVMRRATAADEIATFADPRVRANPAYFAIVAISRTVTRLGSLEALAPAHVERLFVEDLNFLQDHYNRINYGDESAANVPEDDAGGLSGNVEALPFRMSSTKR